MHRKNTKAWNCVLQKKIKRKKMAKASKKKQKIFWSSSRIFFYFWTAIPPVLSWKIPSGDTVSFLEKLQSVEMYSLQFPESRFFEKYWVQSSKIQWFLYNIIWILFISTLYCKTSQNNTLDISPEWFWSFFWRPHHFLSVCIKCFKM